MSFAGDDAVLAAVRKSGGARMRVADLVEQFGPGTKAALLRLKEQRRVAIFPGDNPRIITKRDLDNAISIAGQPHIFVFHDERNDRR